MKTKTSLTLACAAIALLSACETTTSGGATATGGGGLRSEVEIIDGDTYTATWVESPSATIRLAYDSSIALSDTRIIEIAEMMSGCQGTGAGVETSLVGGTTSVRVPVSCGAAAA